MNYEMDELLPVVAELANKYTGSESTSITYEKAEQLMEAILYCIDHMEKTGAYMPESRVKLSARQAYEIGYNCVGEKVKKALCIYHEILPEFDSYGNQCLYDTFIKGIPEFFKWYDVKFNPQETILTLDYPVLEDLSEYEGVDKIYEYLCCIRREQVFLKKFSRNDVVDSLRRYHSHYEELIENVCELFLRENDQEYL